MKGYVFQKLEIKGYVKVAAPNSDSKKAYTELYKEKLDAGHFEAMRDLLPALHSSSVMGFTAE